MTKLSNKKTELILNVATKENLSSFSGLMDLLKEEYGEMKLTAEMRQQLAQELGEDVAVTDKWQSVVDVLDHIDMVELAKKHPEAIGKFVKTIISVISCIFPQIGIANQLPEELAAKLVGYAGTLTPEHLLNLVAKHQVEKNRKKQELFAQQETLALPESNDPLPVEVENTQPVEGERKSIKSAIADGSKKTLNGISNLFSKKKDSTTPEKNDDVLDTIKKLSELKDLGVITQEEFDAKKAELLTKL